jgi:hypothetical protein
MNSVFKDYENILVFMYMNRAHVIYMYNCVLTPFSYACILKVYNVLMYIIIIHTAINKESIYIERRPNKPSFWASWKEFDISVNREKNG